MMTVRWCYYFVLWSMNDGSYSNATLSIWHMKLYDKASMLKEFHADMAENIPRKVNVQRMSYPFGNLEIIYHIVASRNNCNY